MYNVIFEEKYVNYSQISNVELMDINDVLVENDIYIDIGDDFVYDWGGYAYYYAKSDNKLDDESISSFVYVITWFMTSNALDINPNFKSSKYYKNDKIIDECLKIYDNLMNEYDSEVELCSKLFVSIYNFYIENHKEYIKQSERINCLLGYDEIKLLDSVDGKTRTDKIKNLLHYYYNVIHL